MDSNRAIGTKYEQIAGEYLQRQGLKILEYNFSCKKSEIDIIAKDKGTIVFVEVKYRSGNIYGIPEASVDKRKQAKIRYGATVYLTKYNLFESIDCRFDVISITGKDIVWIKDAF